MRTEENVPLAWKDTPEQWWHHFYACADCRKHQPRPARRWLRLRFWIAVRLDHLADRFHA